MSKALMPKWFGPAMAISGIAALISSISLLKSKFHGDMGDETPEPDFCEDDWVTVNPEDWGMSDIDVFQEIGT